MSNIDFTPGGVGCIEWMDALAENLRAAAAHWGKHAQLSPEHWVVATILGSISDSVARANEGASIENKLSHGSGERKWQLVNAH